MNEWSGSVQLVHAQALWLTSCADENGIILVYSTLASGWLAHVQQFNTKKCSKAALQHMHHQTPMLNAAEPKPRYCATVLQSMVWAWVQPALGEYVT